MSSERVVHNLWLYSTRPEGSIGQPKYIKFRIFCIVEDRYWIPWSQAAGRSLAFVSTNKMPPDIRSSVKTDCERAECLQSAQEFITMHKHNYRTIIFSEYNNWNFLDFFFVIFVILMDIWRLNIFFQNICKCYQI